MIATRSKILTDAFHNFVENRSPQQAAQQLRRILFGYLLWQMEAGVCDDMRKEIWLVSDLIDMLELADQYAQLRS
jgi:hypothetical protein